MKDTLEKEWIAGFWRRIGAFAIDSILLGLVGLAIGSLFEEWLVEIGSAGRLIGFFIAVTYFGSMNSTLFNGQTVGKGILNLRVVNSENETISVGVSVFRYCVLGIPFFLNGVSFNEELFPEILTSVLALVVFGGMLSTIYLYIFNRVTRQSLHDLCARTFVVNANSEQKTLGNVWKTHYLVVVCLLVISILFPVILLSHFESSGLISKTSHKDLMHIRDRLLLLPEVNQASISVKQSTITSVNDGTHSSKYLQVQAFINHPDTDNEEIAIAIANAAHENYPEVAELQAINVILTYGFDIGIASIVDSNIHQFNPADVDKHN